jgi:hypothetical protein
VVETKEMTFKSLLLWLMLAAALLGASFWHYQRSRIAAPGPQPILPQLRPEEVTNVQVRLEGQLEIRAQRADGQWKLTQPILYPAEQGMITNLLAALQQITPAVYISPREVMEHPNGEEDYGFPQATIIVKQGDYRAQLFLGSRTTPGDQVFLQVVGDQGIYVVDADLLRHVPASADDWRRRSVFDVTAACDRITITNAANGFELRRESPKGCWSIVTSDVAARADSSKVDEFLNQLRALRIHRFVSDGPKLDLETVGLQNPEFQCAIGQGTNVTSSVQFGKSPTNEAKQVFARRAGENTLLLLNRDGPTPWPTSLSFRDTHLLSQADWNEVNINGLDQFRLVRSTNECWRVLPQDIPADAAAVRDLLAFLGQMQIEQFVRDIVPEQPQALAEYGLAEPLLEYALRASGTNDLGGGTNGTLVSLRFGVVTNQPDKVFARRSDESAVYAINTTNFQKLANASWQLRDRRIWKFAISDLMSITVEQDGKTRQLVRQGDHRWSAADGAQGMIEPMAIEETVLDLVDLSARAWLARGTNILAQWFKGGDQKITLQFKNGEKRTIELSSQLGPQFGIAQAILDGEPWVFAIPGSLRRDMALYLSIPGGQL